jgi:hypothetical protein
MKKTCNIGLIKNNVEAHLFVQELLEQHLELHITFFGHLHFFVDAVPLTMAAYKSLLTSDVITEADGRDSELEGTSCVSIKVSAAVNSLRAYSLSSKPSFVPNR